MVLWPALPIGGEPLRTHIASIKGTGQSMVLRSLDNRPAILKHSELVGIKTTLHKISVPLNGPELREALPKRSQIELARIALVDLHRIATAHGIMRRSFAFKIMEFTHAARPACWITRKS